MKLEIINGDLFDSDAYLAIQSVNCQGVQGSGIALQFKNRYPKQYLSYKGFGYNHNYIDGFCVGLPKINGEEGFYKSHTKLGLVHFWRNLDQNGFRFIANCHTQEFYGYDGKRYSNYEAIFNCFEKVRDFLLFKMKTDTIAVENKGIALPYGIASCRGGADWRIVEKMLECLFNDTLIRVRLYKFN